VRDGWDETVWAGLFDFLNGNPGELNLLESTELSDALAGATVVVQLLRSQKYRCRLPKGPDGPCVDLSRSREHARVGAVKNNQHTEFYRSAVPALADKGRCSIHVLLSGEGREIAAIICYSFEQTLYVHHTVYDPEFSSYSPGKLLTGLVTADLLCGFADYYKPWAARIIATINVEVLRLSPVSRLQLPEQWIKGKI
jgi:hypothetical protein